MKYDTELLDELDGLLSESLTSAHEPISFFCEDGGIIITAPWLKEPIVTSDLREALTQLKTKSAHIK